jgi:hypothetical protein
MLKGSEVHQKVDEVGLACQEGPSYRANLYFRIIFPKESINFHPVSITIGQKSTARAHRRTEQLKCCCRPPPKISVELDQKLGVAPIPSCRAWAFGPCFAPPHKLFPVPPYKLFCVCKQFYCSRGYRTVPSECSSFL